MTKIEYHFIYISKIKLYDLNIHALSYDTLF